MSKSGSLPSPTWQLTDRIGHNQLNSCRRGDREFLTLEANRPATAPPDLAAEVAAAAAKTDGVGKAADALKRITDAAAARRADLAAVEAQITQAKADVERLLVEDALGDKYVHALDRLDALGKRRGPLQRQLADLDRQAVEYRQGLGIATRQAAGEATGRMHHAAVAERQQVLAELLQVIGRHLDRLVDVERRLLALSGEEAVKLAARVADAAAAPPAAPAPTSAPAA